MKIKRFNQLYENVEIIDKIKITTSKYDELFKLTIKFLKEYNEIIDIVEIYDFWNNNMISYDDSLGNKKEYEFSKDSMKEYKKYLKEKGINDYKKIISDKNNLYLQITDYLKLMNLCKDNEYTDDFWYNNTDMIFIVHIAEGDFGNNYYHEFNEIEYKTLLTFINNYNENKDISAKKYNI